MSARKGRDAGSGQLNSNWIDEAPAHWQIRRIKTIFEERDERNSGLDGLLLSLTRARGLVPHGEASDRVARAENLSAYKVCRPGDLVMNRMQAWTGMFAIASETGVVSPDYAVFESVVLVEAPYFEFLFRSPVMVSEFARRSKGIGSGFNRLYTPDFGSIHVAVPPVEEQVLLVRYLNDAIQLIRRYVTGIERLVGPGTQSRSGLLAEYRVRLITDVVTGRLDVREAAARLPDEVDEPDPFAESDGLTDAEDDSAGHVDAVVEEVEA